MELWRRRLLVWFGGLLLLGSHHSCIFVDAVFSNARLTLHNPQQQQQDQQPQDLQVTMTDNFKGSQLRTITGPLHLAPVNNSYLCDANYRAINDMNNNIQNNNTRIALVPRGRCTFEQKAVIAEGLGFRGIIVYNTLESKYDEAGSVRYPKEKYDYECGARQGGPSRPISVQDLPPLDPPWYSGSTHDAYLSWSDNNGNSTKNVCHLAQPSLCDSKRCFLTGPANKEEDGMLAYTACCAWDLLVNIGGDEALSTGGSRNVVGRNFVSAFCTMQHLDAAQGTPYKCVVHNFVVFGNHDRYNCFGLVAFGQGLSLGYENTAIPVCSRGECRIGCGD